jgi:mannose-6-phosphate isomerase-like protein (cupin superfamily)
MKTIPVRKLLTLIAAIVSVNAFADDHEGGSTIISKAEVSATLQQGLERLAEGRTISDIVMRHIDVGEENLGVSVVQRSKKEVGDIETGIAHPTMDEIYYIVSGEGTMVTGGEFVDMQSSNSALLGPMERGEVLGVVLQKVEPGDIAIIPKGMPHGWHEITTDTISYIIFRGDPDKVMDIKSGI